VQALLEIKEQKNHRRFSVAFNNVLSIHSTSSLLLSFVARKRAKTPHQQSGLFTAKTLVSPAI
jgi:hypothetical protein